MMVCRNVDGRAGLKTRILLFLRIYFCFHLFEILRQEKKKKRRVLKNIQKLSDGELIWESQS